MCKPRGHLTPACNSPSAAVCPTVLAIPHPCGGAGSGRSALLISSPPACLLLLDPVTPFAAQLRFCSHLLSVKSGLRAMRRAVRHTARAAMSSKPSQTPALRTSSTGSLRPQEPLGPPLPKSVSAASQNGGKKEEKEGSGESKSSKSSKGRSFFTALFGAWAATVSCLSNAAVSLEGELGRTSLALPPFVAPLP